LRVLLITGGCCHDYSAQKDLLKKGLEERANVEVTQVHTDDKTTKARFAIYEQADWAKGYDAVIHDECSADVKDLPYEPVSKPRRSRRREEADGWETRGIRLLTSAATSFRKGFEIASYVQNILHAHQEGVGAVNLHCAMHCYRTGTDDWFQFVGIQSTSHGPQEPIAIRFLDPSHAVTRGLEDWSTIKEELYNNVKVFPTAHPLARGRQVVKRHDGTEKTEDAVVAWANEYGKGKVFSTTLGHNNGTVSDPRYLDLVARGLLWSCAKLNADGKPQPGYARPSPR
jgi:type 1 glutamine amidotransferase